MANTLNTNVSALGALRALAETERMQGRALTRVSTGTRLQSAADDVAGVAAVSKFTSQVRGLDQAVRNANDGISMLQVADGAAGSIQSMLFRMRDLAVQAASGTYSGNDRDALDGEFQELETEVARLVEHTQWNGTALLDGTGGTGGTLHFHIGPGATDDISIAFTDVGAGALATARSITDDAAAQSAIGSIDQALDELDDARAHWGALMNRLSHAADHGESSAIQMAASRSRIADTDYARETADLARSMILRSAGSAMLSQASYQPRLVLALLR